MFSLLGILNRAKAGDTVGYLGCHITTLMNQSWLLGLRCQYKASQTVLFRVEKMNMAFEKEESIYTTL
ncbi:hypothetical protein VULLAG_LOCUS12751 [Vulpes lagopus]